MTAGVGVSAPTAPRVGIVGVRRLRQGLGEHFARWLVAAGAQVPAFIGRTPESIDEGRRLLLARGIDARGFTSLAELRRAEPIEALVIASPAETHEAWLRKALAARLHVLCEKPLVWGGDDPAGTAYALVMDFLSRDLLLAEHCQWPFTLPAFRRLHPESAPEPLRTFEFELCPASRGEDMLVDAMSHPVSMVQALLAGDARCGTDQGSRLVPVGFSKPGPGEERLDAELEVRDERGARIVQVVVRLIHGSAEPRHAAYTINGRRAVRRISLPGYTMTLADGVREVPMEDPMRLAVADFVRGVIERRAPRDERPGLEADLVRMLDIPTRMHLVSEIVSAFRSRSGD